MAFLNKWKDGGELEYQREGDKIRIIRADPKIWISNELMFVWYTNPIFLEKDFHVNIQWRDGPVPRIHNAEGTVLTFSDDFGTKFIYVVKEFDFAALLWLAEWPD